MTAMVRWSDREARALRDARRRSVRAFAAHLDVAIASVTNWQKRGERIRLRDETQEILDWDLSRASDEVPDRFEAAFRQEGAHRGASQPTMVLASKLDPVLVSKSANVPEAADFHEYFTTGQPSSPRVRSMGGRHY